MLFLLMLFKQKNVPLSEWLTNKDTPKKFNTLFLVCIYTSSIKFGKLFRKDDYWIGVIQCHNQL